MHNETVDSWYFRHLPNYPLIDEDIGSIPSQQRVKLTESTLPIRFYGVDAPETAKNGNPGMAYANDATEYTKSKILDSNQIVSVKILSIDRYSRIVGVVTTTSPILLDLSEGLASEGYAFLYAGKGAQYDGRRQDLVVAIEKAQRMKKGMWKNGIDGVQSPADYKRMIKTKTI